MSTLKSQAAADYVRENGDHPEDDVQMDGFVKPMPILRIDQRLRAAAEQQPQLKRELWALLHEAATEIERLRAAAREKQKTEPLQEALRALLAEPHGCGFCDSGKLRNPAKPHTDDCGFALAERALGPNPKISGA